VQPASSKPRNKHLLCMSWLDQGVVNSSFSDSIDEVDQGKRVRDVWIIEASDVCRLASMLQLQYPSTSTDTQHYNYCYYYYGYLYIAGSAFSATAFSALTLLVGWQKGDSACK